MYIHLAPDLQAAKPSPRLLSFDVSSIEKGRVPPRGNCTIHLVVGARAANLQTNPVDTYG